MVLKVKIFEAKYKAKLEFPRGSRGAKQKTLRGGVWIFSGTAQLEGHRFDSRLDYQLLCGKQAHTHPRRKAGPKGVAEIEPSLTPVRRTWIFFF